MRSFDDLWALVGDLELLVHIALNKSGSIPASVAGTGFWKSVSGVLQPTASIGLPGQVPTTNQVGSNITWQDVLSSWVPVSGGTFTPDNSQKAILADASGAQIFINTPTNPYDGQVLLIYDYEGLAALNPIVVIASAGQAIEDPATPGNDPGASGHIGMQGMTACWKYFASASQWELMFVSTPYVATPNSWAQTTWFIDPVDGNDQNPGTTIGKPLQTKLELSRRFNGWTPTINATAVTIEYLNPDTTNTDPALFDPTLTNGGSLTQIAVLPAAGFTGTLNVVTAKNVTGNAALRSTFTTTTGAIAAGMMLVNATRGNSRAFVQRNVTGGTWQLTQPLQPYVTGTFPSATNVDTWQSGDAITGYALMNVNIPRVTGVLADFNGSFSNGNFVRQLNIWDPSGVGLAPVNVDANVVPYLIECSCSRMATTAGSGQAAQATFLNFFTASQWFGRANTANGILIAGGALDGGGFLGGGTLSNDVEIGAAGLTIEDSQISEAFVDTSGTLVTQGNCSMVNTTGRLFGAGLANVKQGCLTYSGETAVNAFPIAGGLALMGSANGYSNATSAGTTTVHHLALTAANLDATAGATGFGGLAYAGAACISNGTQP